MRQHHPFARESLITGTLGAAAVALIPGRRPHPRSTALDSKCPWSGHPLWEDGSGRHPDHLVSSVRYTSLHLAAFLAIACW
jgi:hypothetical protein